MSGIYYHGSDGHIKELGDRELQHWKYIKKIGDRYFYTLDELRKYYNEEKVKAEKEYKKDVAKDSLHREKRDSKMEDTYKSKSKFRIVRMIQQPYLNKDRKNVEQANKRTDRTVDTYRKAEKKVKPVLRAVNDVRKDKVAEEKNKKENEKIRKKKKKETNRAIREKRAKEFIDRQYRSSDRLSRRPPSVRAASRR